MVDLTRQPTLSKSDFLKYQICPSYFWLWKHKRDVVPLDEEEDIKRRLEQGNEVERLARQLFDDAVLIEDSGQRAMHATEQTIAAGATTIFQATVVTATGLLAMADVIDFNEATQSWTLYEVKSTNSIKPEHIYDVAFQQAVFEAAGYVIGAVGVIYLNKDYLRQPTVIPEDFFITSLITERVGEILPTIRQQANDALTMLARLTEPKTCSCRLKSKGQHCPTFYYLNTEIPEYSVFNISRIGGKNLALLVDNETFHVHEVSEDVKLTQPQQNQVDAARTKEVKIDRRAILTLLDELEYPLYFLDYETISTAIPLYDGCTPFQQVPFQYSLHVIRQPDAAPEHYEFLARSAAENPVPALLQSLAAAIGPTGSVLVWYKIFEAGRNKEMGQAHPEYADFLSDVNDRIFDLMDVFSKQHFVHPEFKGSNSIKAVLPVLVPHLSYKEMDIQNGQNAQARWYDAITGTVDEAEAKGIFEALIKYCCLDTIAMVEIFQALLKA